MATELEIYLSKMHKPNRLEELAMSCDRSFRERYIPEHLEDERMPYTMWFLVQLGYLSPPYFDWTTKTVTQ
jgi:hypothetical protein